MAKKKIAIVGAGAVGCYAGAHMVQAGEDVTYIDPWPENVEAIRNDGLRVTHIRDVEPFTVKPRALHLTEAQQLAKEAPIDIAFVCMKSYDTAWATALIKQYLAPGGYVVSLQNCMNEETIAGIVGWGKTLGSIASSITVELHAPGQVRRAAGKSGSRHTVFRVGEVHGRKTDRAEEVRKLVGYADSSMVTENLWGERWSKLVTNVMGNGLSACTGHDQPRHGQERRDPAFLEPARAARRSVSDRRSATRLMKSATWTRRPWPAPAKAIPRRKKRSTITAWPRPTGPAAASTARRWARTWSRGGAPRSSF